MEYVLLVFDDPAELRRLAPGERERIGAEYAAFTRAIRRSGHFRSGRAMAPPTTATTIRVRAGKRALADGACAATKEHLVGYYLVEAADLDEAIEIAARVPANRFGAVEVRPVLRRE